jgi:hypothetical protein
VYALRKIIAGRHPTDKGTVVQAVLRPWQHSNKQQRDSLQLPASYLRQPLPSAPARSSASSSGVGPPILAAPPAASGAAVSVPPVPPGAHGEGDPPKEDPPVAQVPPPLEEEWDLEALAAWFGDP